MSSEGKSHQGDENALSELLGDIGGPGSTRTGVYGTRRAIRWAPLALFLAVVALVAALLPGIVDHLGESVRSVLDPSSRVASELAAIPGIASVGEAETRAGDLTFRNNVFFTVIGQDGLSRPGQDQLIDAISATLATAQGNTRYMVELDLGTVSVGISSVAGLNATRIGLARDLADVAGVVRATVLWHTNDDDLIVDDDNSGLDIWVQAQDGRVIDLVDQSLPLLRTADAPDLTAIILGRNPPSERLYSWGERSGPERGERQITVQANDVSEVRNRQVADELDGSQAVIGYRLTSQGATIAFVEGIDVRETLNSLSIPAEWDVVDARTAQGEERWTREQAGTIPSISDGWHVTEYG